MSQESSTYELWLRSLQRQVYPLVQDPRSSHYWCRNERQLTWGEWCRVLELTSELQLPLFVRPGQFSFSLLVHNPGSVQGVKPPVVLEIEGSQIPPEAKKDRLSKMVVLRELEALVFSDQNQQILASCGFDPRSLRRVDILAEVRF